MISYNSCRSLTPQNSSRFKREICDPNLSEASPDTQELLPHCSEPARQIPLQSLSEHACSYRREHKAVWHGLLFSFATLDMSVLPFPFCFHCLSFSTWTHSGESRRSPSKGGGSVCDGVTSGILPHHLLTNSKWNGFTRLQKSFHFLSFYQLRWKAGLYLISV